MRIPSTRLTLIVVSAVAIISFLFVGVRARGESLLVAVVTGEIQLTPACPAQPWPSYDTATGTVVTPPTPPPPPGCGIAVPYRWVLIVCVVVIAGRLIYRERDPRAGQSGGRG